MEPKKPFWLSRQRCGFIFLFENLDLGLPCLLDELDPEGLTVDYKASAKALIDNLDDHWCVCFLEALRDECTRRIDEHWKKIDEYWKEVEEFKIELDKESK